jgi:hypothetical protein
MIRPRIYPQTEQEKEAWFKLIAEIQKQGVLKFAVNYQENKTITETDDCIEYEITATTINTKEKLIKACNIDLNKWEILSFRVSTWQQKENGTQLFAVRCKFKQKNGVSAEDIIKAIDNGLKHKIKPYTPDYDHKPNGENVALINMFDAHIDKVTRLTETGEQTTIEENVAKFYAAFSYLLNKANKPDLIIFPIGNDFFNVNDSRYTTKKGTPQDSNVNFIDAFEIGMNLLIDCIDNCAKIANVYIPIIAGNHAEDLEYLLGVTLSKIYQFIPGIEIDYSRKYRKYVTYGHNLFMFAHGDKVKNKIKEIPQIMSTEQPEKWAAAKYRYAIFGDIHHEQTHDLRGVKAMFLRSVSHSDKWHTDNGYFANKTAYLQVYSKCGKFTRSETINF